MLIFVWYEKHYLKPLPLFYTSPANITGLKRLTGRRNGSLKIDQCVIGGALVEQWPIKRVVGHNIVVSEKLLRMEHRTDFAISTVLCGISWNVFMHTYFVSKWYGISQRHQICSGYMYFILLWLNYLVAWIHVICLRIFFRGAHLGNLTKIPMTVQ